MWPPLAGASPICYSLLTLLRRRRTNRLTRGTKVNARGCAWQQLPQGLSRSVSQRRWLGRPRNGPRPSPLYFFLWLLQQIATNLVASNNINLLLLIWKPEVQNQVPAALAPLEATTDSMFWALPWLLVAVGKSLAFFGLWVHHPSLCVHFTWPLPCMCLCLEAPSPFSCKDSSHWIWS